jgi:outer membrane protein OmpA-like peptidoglycan-associated protein
MNRMNLVALIAGVALIEFLSLRACFQAVFPAEGSSHLPKIDNSVVATSDGSVMVAQPGTVSRDVIDWLNDKSAGPRKFDIGRQPFVPNSDDPAPEAEVRLARFARELKANPDVNARILVCSSARDGADQQLAASRAQRLKEELAEKLIDASRISTEPCRTSTTPGSAPSAEQDGQVISIALFRGD